ncbi:MAG: hypothetical protein JNM88_17960 [Chitinophagaceae bacterium]|nr:hypothetical protein [Chitinophagaceae bacterium]
MKYVFFLFLLAGIAVELPAQTNSVAAGAARSPTTLRNVLQDMIIKPRPHAGISGSPFLNDNWLLASVVFADGRKADSVLIKLNAYENKLHFIDDNGEELQATLRVKHVKILDANPSWNGLEYRCGFSGDPDAFYQVLQDGDGMQLLKKVMLKVWQARAMGEEDKRSFEYEEEYFLAIGTATVSSLYKPGKKCELPAEALGDKKDAVEKYISANGIRGTKTDDLKKLVTYFNSL